jgi:hypothetical protein
MLTDIVGSLGGEEAPGMGCEKRAEDMRQSYIRPASPPTKAVIFHS